MSMKNPWPKLDLLHWHFGDLTSFSYAPPTPHGVSPHLAWLDSSFCFFFITSLTFTASVTVIQTDFPTWVSSGSASHHMDGESYPASCQNRPSSIQGWPKLFCLCRPSKLLLQKAPPGSLRAPEPFTIRCNPGSGLFAPHFPIPVSVRPRTSSAASGDEADLLTLSATDGFFFQVSKTNFLFQTSNWDLEK